VHTSPALPGSRPAARHLWWLGLAALLPVAAALLARRLRARRAAGTDAYEQWWQARAAARAAGVTMPVPSRNGGSALFV
jgi:uncharacterized membrane protein YhaH (DUF805 family)